MKRLIVLQLLMAAVVVCRSQDDITICHTEPTEKFAFLASNKEFNASHPTPRRYVHNSVAGGKMIQFKCPDGSTANGYVLTADTKTDNWILVFQEWWGLNDNIKRESESFFTDLGNVNVLALDMYDGKLATERDAAAQYMQAFKQERGDVIVKGALAYVGKSARIGTVGWCFGGGQSLLAALQAGKQSAACVIYYGMPVEDVSVLKKLNADVLGIFGVKDQWINPDVVKKFEANMKTAGKNLVVHSYDADHGFANPSNPLGAFNETAYKDAYQHTVSFFKERLK